MDPGSVPGCLDIECVYIVIDYDVDQTSQVASRVSMRKPLCATPQQGLLYLGVRWLQAGALPTPRTLTGMSISLPSVIVLIW